MRVRATVAQSEHTCGPCSYVYVRRSFIHVPLGYQKFLLGIAMYNNNKIPREQHYFYIGVQEGSRGK